jgi:prepilin-type N-terminal cleavage/methylation domain-containing protein
MEAPTMRPLASRRAAVARARAGFTLIEMMLAVTISLLVFAAAVPFFRNQTRAIDTHAGRLDAQLNARYALTAVDRDLRAAGVGIVDVQPMLVYAGPRALTFNSDLVAMDSVDAGAVSYDPDANLAETGVLQPINKITLPLSTLRYPDSLYRQAGPTSPHSRAETISYWASLDSTSGRADQYVVFRRVNHLAPMVVARGVIIPAGQPVFRYFKTDSLGRPIEIPQTSLPLHHSAILHGAPSDTGRFALIDSVRIVRTRMIGLYRDSRKQKDLLDTAQGGIRIMNAGLMNRKTCGEAPLLGSANFVATRVRLGGNGSPYVSRLTWVKAGDEAGGEKDVERYALYRRPAGAAAFGEPFASVAAGDNSYTFDDSDVKSGESWQYAVSAQDCSLLNSPLGVAATTIIIP